MATWTQEIRSVPLWLVRDYLVDLGGHAESDERVVGEGWTGQLTELEDHQLGSLSMPSVRLELDGSDLVLKPLIDDLQLRLLRAGSP